MKYVDIEKEQEQLKSKVEAIRRVIAGLDKVDTERKHLQEMLEYPNYVFGANRIEPRYSP